MQVKDKTNTETAMQVLVVEATHEMPPRISRFDAAIDFKFQQVVSCNCILSTSARSRIQSKIFCLEY